MEKILKAGDNVAAKRDIYMKEGRSLFLKCNKSYVVKYSDGEHIRIDSETMKDHIIMYNDFDEDENDVRTFFILFLK